MRSLNIDQHKFAARFRSLMLVAALLIAGCASMRHFERAGTGASLAGTTTFYVVVNGATEKVDYNYLGPALIPGFVLDYEKYAKDRVRGDAKLDVPLEILKDLKGRGKSASFGPAELAPREDAIIVSYDELWGWDMRPIIKALSIHASPAGRPTEEVSVKFEEMTIFNTQPVARSLVPAMMNILFESADTKPLAGGP